ncbi:MAG: 2-hydroxy-3-oxopropionate reductase [Deltaproteobacteria bacterium]|nr:2-hydroxy-3-oxopropionate reductase [Deltaproteobacteria bacterium]
MTAFFGMGKLGSGFVRALRRRGKEVRVWNRTHARAQALEAWGAAAFQDPAEAARGATRLHLALSDDASVDEVLEQARAGFAAGVTIVDHTTTSATGTAARVARWADRGITFVHAPVFMGPQNALDSTGIMLVSGDPARVEALRPALEAMTGKLSYLGPRTDAAAAFKLMGNLLLMFLTTGLADLLALAKATGVLPEDAAKLLDVFNPGVTVAARMNRMVEGKFSEPSWELAMARKDARLMLEEAARAHVPLAVLPAIAARMDTVIAEGHGSADWTVLAKDALTR